MAFSDEDTVSMTLFATLGVNGSVGPLVQAQPPKFGVVAAAAGVDVLWEDGWLSAGIAAAALDKIGTATSQQITDFQGKIVEPTTSSPEYQGIVVAMYTRDVGAAGSPSATLALVRTNDGTYRECLLSNLAVVSGR